MITLGIDTSNYTTSCALYDSAENTITQRKLLLPVKEGEKGLRQSDAVFHHTQQLYPLIDELFSVNHKAVDAIGASERPRDAEGSYMPCFTVGKGTAMSISSVTSKPYYGFSHQCGHIMAALYSAGKMNFINSSFIAFHVSGGTTEALLVKPDADRIFDVEIVGKTLDLNCGQAIDRAGVMMGMKFPCGKEIEKCALDSAEQFKPKVFVKDCNCSLSGLENKCRDLYSSGASIEDVSAFCLAFISDTLFRMTEQVLEKTGNLPVVYAGGVMSDKIIRNNLSSHFGSYFAEPEYSCDNAAGIALLTYIRSIKNV